ncbi:hypothetical protein EGM51_16425 [Verrucomicrobia bacterium S94]|nr:hypothetical protein EGM51_16425 [Verrucomicrobia bacterium S94]
MNMKKEHLFSTLSITALMTAAAVYATDVLNLDFIASEGFSEGGTLDGTAALDTQSGWYAVEVNGTGIAVCSNQWNRATGWASFSLGIGESAVIETTLRISDADGIFSDGDLLRAGFAHNSVNPGGKTPSIGSYLHTAANGTYWFGSEAATNRITVNSSDTGDWITFTQYITRSAVSNTFTGLAFATNLTKGVNLGSFEASWSQTTDDGSWNDVMRPGIQYLSASQDSAVEIDRWTVYTTAEPPPNPDFIIPSQSGSETNSVIVSIDITRKRAIGGFSGFNRDTWFGIYQDTGSADWISIDGKDPNEWVYEDGNMLPSRGTWDFEKYWNGNDYTYFSEDPLRPGFLDTNEVYSTYSPGRLIYAKELAPHHRTVMSGAGHGRFAEFICWPTNLTHGVLTVSNHQSHAEATSAYFKKIHDVNALMPYWYEVMNESTIQNNFGWHWDSDSWDKLAEFHNAVADRMAVDWPDVKVAGPTDAYAFRDGPDSSFTTWMNTNKKFIELSGKKIGAYAFHAYEHDFTKADQGSYSTVYDAQYSHYNVWSKGRLESFIDLWENEHEIRWGDRRPFVMSEYGILGWDETNYFTYLKSCNAMLVKMMDRPDIMDKMSVFILMLTHWDVANRNAMFVWNYDTETWEKSPAYNYLYFWGDLNGDYLFNRSGSYHLLSRAFLDEDQLYVVLHNNYNNPFSVNLQNTLPAGTTITNAVIKKLYGNGSNLVYEAYTPLTSTTNILLETEATAIVRFTLSGTPELPLEFEDSYYGNKVLEDIDANTDETFTIHIPAGVNENISGGTLYYTLHKADGFSYNPEITFNSISLTNAPDITHAAGVVRCWKQFAVPVPADTLTEGDNTVQLRFPAAGGKITNVRLALVGDGRNFISGIPLLDGGMQVECPTQPGRNYRVMRSADLLQAGSWTEIARFPGSGETEIIEDPDALPQQFYKVEISTP